MTSEEKWQQIVQSLEDKEYRDAFVAAEIETGIPFQIKAMRKSRGWNQHQLAAAASMTQARISLLENADYEGAVNVKTLEKLASAFDVGLVVRFAPFSELVDWTTRLSAQDHDVPEYAKDEALQRRWVTVTATAQNVGAVFIVEQGTLIAIDDTGVARTVDGSTSVSRIVSTSVVSLTSPATTHLVVPISETSNKLAA